MAQIFVYDDGEDVNRFFVNDGDDLGTVLREHHGVDPDDVEVRRPTGREGVGSRNSELDRRPMNLHLFDRDYETGERLE